MFLDASTPPTRLPLVRPFIYQEPGTAAPADVCVLFPVRRKEP